MPKASEVASLHVGGQSFEDWESVWVQHRWSDGWPLFRFTAAERANQPTLWTKLQFKPGDKCTILLGGQLAITGIITERQVAYDAANHSVQLSGKGETWAAATSSIEIKNSHFDEMTLKAAIDKALKPFSTKAITVGTLDQTKFDRLQSQPGELVFDFCDRICRVRGATLGSDHLGNMLVIGKHSYPIVQQLYEGQNILKMQCVFNNEQMSNIYSHTAQRAVEDQSSMRKSNEMQARATGQGPGIFKFLETVAEQPVKTDAELEARANYEAIQRESTLIIAYVTVQGWLRDGSNLWRTGDNVWVVSPMAMLNMAMKIQTATFQQDNKSGTTTTLELVLPWRLADKPFGHAPATPEAPTYPQAGDPVVDAGVPQPPPPATTTSDKPAGPPTQYLPPSPPISQ
jgi:prophage tail gpP-like protein